MTELIKLCVSGASGRSGSLVVALLHEYPQFQLCGALVAPGSEHYQKVCKTAQQNSGREVRYTDSVAEAMQGADAVIDFSTPQVSLQILRIAAAIKAPALIATTGHSQDERAEIVRLAEQAAVLLASNTSTAVFVMQEICLLAQKLCGTDFDIEIFELHHRLKKDAPSGTALTLAQTLSQDGALKTRTSRDGKLALREDLEIGVAALRGGDVPGEHTVFFLGEGERIEVTQRARDRSVFARGALRLMLRLHPKPAALYSVKDLYNR